MHPLLVRLLGTRRSAASSRRLHRRAGEWCAATDRCVEAAVHLATARDWSDAASALVNGYAIAHLWGGPRARWLLAAFAGMPPDTPGAQSAVVLAAAAVARRDAEAAAKQLGRAEELIDDVPPDRAGALALALAVAAAGLARLSGDADRALDARAALDRAAAEVEAGGATGPIAEAARSSWPRWGPACCAPAGSRRPPRCWPSATAVPPPFVAVRSVLTARRSLVEALRGHLTVARELAEGACAAPADTDPADGRSRRHGPVEAHAALAWVAVESGSPAEAEQHTDAAAGADDPVVAGVLALVRARSLRAAGRPDDALSVLAATRHPVGRDAPPSWLDGMLVAAAAAVWTAGGRPERALQALADAGHGGPDVCLETARAHLAGGDVDRCADEVAALLRRGDLMLGVRVEAWLLRAEAALAGRDRKVAEHAADRALRTATDERLLRPVLEAPPRLRGLLHAARPDLVGSRRGTGAGRGRRPGVGSRSASPPLPAPTPGRPVVVEPLTAREQEVLGYLSALLSTEEIAEMMFVSVNTVKSHVRGILRKLGAPRRNDAIRPPGSCSWSERSIRPG